MDRTTTAVLVGTSLLVALVASSRNLSSFWTLMYKVMMGAVAGGICYFVLQKVDTTDDVKMVSSFVVGLFVCIASSGIPWR